MPTSIEWRYGARRPRNSLHFDDVQPRHHHPGRYKMPRKTLKTIWNEIVHGKRHILPARFHFRNRKRTNRQHFPPFRVLFILLNNDSSGSKTKQIFKFHLDSIAGRPNGIWHIKAGERRNCPQHCQQQPKSGYKQTNGPSSCLFLLSPSCLPASLMLQHTYYSPVPCA